MEIQLKEEYVIEDDKITFDEYTLNTSVLAIILSKIMNKLEGFKEGSISVKIRDGIRIADTATIPFEDVNVLYYIVSESINVTYLEYIEGTSFLNLNGSAYFVDGFNFGRFPLSRIQSATKSEITTLTDDIVLKHITGDMYRFEGKNCNSYIHLSQMRKLVSE